jgi:hypothetical protein
MSQRNDGGPPAEVFADGIGWIGVHGGVVRIDFFSFATPDAATAHGTATGRTPEKEPERVVRQRVVMPLDGFIRSLGAMTDLVRKLEEGGMLVRKAGAPAAAAAAPAPAPAPAKTGATPAGKPASPSPNFG